MPRGGARTPSEGKKIGRPKTERPVNASVAHRVLAQAKAEQKWLRIIDVESGRIEADPLKASTAGLREALKYLECRAFGNCTDTINHLHDKPIDLNVSLSVSERMLKALERAEERVRTR